MIGMFRRLFDWKLHGFRVVDIFGVACLAVMVFSVYIAKAGAAQVSQEIGDLEREIARKAERVRLLRAEAARLENPARLEALSRQVGLLPPDVDRLASVDELPDLSPLPEPEPPAPPAAQPETAAEAEVTAAPAAQDGEAAR